MNSVSDPHRDQPVLAAGANLRDARLVVILLHGRGGSADEMLHAVAGAVRLADVHYLAPQAAGHTWYPYSILSPLDRNEPALSSALGLIGTLIERLHGEGVGTDRIALLGFSQGACLGLEYAARHARRYAALIGLSGGLIGPDGTPRDYEGTVDGTPVLLGCSDIDPHIPVGRVYETADVFRRLGGQVDLRIYPGMGHTINDDEIGAVRQLLG